MFSLIKTRSLSKKDQKISHVFDIILCSQIKKGIFYFLNNILYFYSILKNDSPRNIFCIGFNSSKYSYLRYVIQSSKNFSKQLKKKLASFCSILKN